MADAVPYRAEILAAVACVHHAIGYQGGRLELRDVLEVLPGLLVAPMEPRDLLGRAGVTMRIGYHVKIGFDSSLPLPERRRVVAHEIGHAILHCGLLSPNGLPGVPFATEAVGEAQADFFAQELRALRRAKRAPRSSRSEGLPPHARAAKRKDLGAR